MLTAHSMHTTQTSLQNQEANERTSQNCP